MSANWTSGILWNFASSLKAHPSYARSGIRLCEKVLDALSGRLLPWNTHVGGSLSNDTDVIIPTYLLLLHMDKRQLLNVKENLESILASTLIGKSSELGICPGSVEINLKKLSARFMFTNGIKVCLILTSDENYYLEEYEQFLREQSEFTKKIVRLMKFWFCSKSDFFGLGADHWKVIELVTVAAATVEELKTKENFLASFKRALDWIYTVDQRVVRLKRSQNESWGIWKEDGLKLKLKRGCEANWIFEVSADDPGKYIMDPISKVNLLSEPLIDSKVKQIKSFAKGAITALSHLETRVYTVKYHGREVMEFDKFFEPLPPPGPKSNGFPSFYNVEFVRGFGKTSRVHIQNEDLIKQNEDIREFVLKLQSHLTTLFGCIMRQGLKQTEIKISAQRSVRTFFKNFLRLQAPEENAEDEFWDVGYHIPYWVLEEDEGTLDIDKNKMNVRCAKVWLAWQKND